MHVLYTCFKFKLIFLVRFSDNGIFVIEVKNWAGKLSVSSDGKSWVRNKRDVDKEKDISISYDQVQDNVLTGIKQKTQLLRNHLLRNEACISEKFFHPRVVLMNSRTVISDQLASTKEVIGPDHLQAFLQSFERGIAWSFANCMIPSFLTGMWICAHNDIRSQSLLKTLSPKIYFLFLF